jgi:hypothetical protein
VKSGTPNYHSRTPVAKATRATALTSVLQALHMFHSETDRCLVPPSKVEAQKHRNNNNQRNCRCGRWPLGFGVMSAFFVAAIQAAPLTYQTELERKCWAPLQSQTPNQMPNAHQYSSRACMHL